MDIKDQNVQARNSYRAAQKELKNSYDKSLKSAQETFDHRTDKMSKNYAESKSKLEEENRVNKELYGDKTKETISQSQEEFRNKLKANADKFESEMFDSKKELSNKLSDLSDSYRTSAQENSRLNDQVKKAMKERFEATNSKLENTFNENTQELANNYKKNVDQIQKDSKSEKFELTRKNANDLNNQRQNSLDDKNTEISKLKDENQAIKETLTRENDFLKSRSEEKIANLNKTKNSSMQNARENFQVAQDKIKNLNELEHQNRSDSHREEIKNIQEKFQKNIETNNKITEQKVIGGSKAETLADQLKEANSSFNAKLRANREELAKNNARNTQEIQKVDQGYQKTFKNLKDDFNARSARQEQELITNKNQEVYATKDKLNSVIDTVKSNLAETDKMAAEKLNHQLEKNAKREKDQRVEFNKVVNHINDKNIENLNSLKEDFSKDKNSSIEGLKTQMAEEKLTMRNEFNRIVSIKDAQYEQKLANLEKQTKKMVESYENKIALIVNKADGEVEALKTNTELKNHKDAENTKLAIESIKSQKENEKSLMRSQYESVIERNQAASDQKVTQLVKKYEDQMTQMKNEHKKEVLTKVSEAESKYNRLSRNTQLNQSLAQSQYDQKLENAKLASLKQDHSKNS